MHKLKRLIVQNAMSDRSQTVVAADTTTTTLDVTTIIRGLIVNSYIKLTTN